jgi:DNA polymerase-3 subunit alpha
MYFGTFIDIEGNWIDTVHFPPSAKQFPFNGPGCYRLSGKVTNEFDFITIEVTTMKRLPMIDMEKVQVTDVVHPGAVEGQLNMFDEKWAS